MKTSILRIAMFFAGWSMLISPPACGDEVAALLGEATSAMKRAASFFRQEVASHGGYVYYYDPTLTRRWGEGEASEDQIWVQPPGTPSVGMAYLTAFQATGDSYYLDAVSDVANSLIYGQLRSGGWTNSIDFDPAGQRVAQYRGQPKRGKNYSSLDDGQTQAAIRFLVEADRALGFKNEKVHEAALFALDCLLAAQFPCGGFPQVWDGPIPQPEPRPANFPEYNWRSAGRIKEYWDLYTLNDNVAVYAAETLEAAFDVYQDDRYLTALKRLGEFLILSQMPDPQPAWAQQYNYEMQPVWARAFEPPAIAGHESQGAIELLMNLYSLTLDPKYLEPIPRALPYLRESQLADGQLARYYELQTNRPLYMQRTGSLYELTYDDSNLPSHYGWKTRSRVGELQAQYDRLLDGLPSGKSEAPSSPEAALRTQLAADVRDLLKQLDTRGRWVSTYDGQRLVGQPNFEVGQQYLSSEVFSRNLTRLAEFVRVVASTDLVGRVESSPTAN